MQCRASIYETFVLSLNLTRLTLVSSRETAISILRACPPNMHTPSSRKYPVEPPRLNTSREEASSASQLITAPTSKMDDASVLILPSPDNSLSTISRLAIFCVAHFVLGFGAGFLYAQFRNRRAAIAPTEDDKDDPHASTASSSSPRPPPSSLATASASRADAVSNDRDSELSDRALTTPLLHISSDETASPVQTPLKKATVDGTSPAGNNSSNILEDVTSPLTADMASTASPITAAKDVHEGGTVQLGDAAGPLRVSRILIYPIKGCAPIEVESARVTAHGFEHDRMFMVIDFTGRDLNQKKYPELTLTRVAILPDGDMQLEAPGQSAVVFTPHSRGTKTPVMAHGVKCEAVDQGDVAADFFARVLEIAGVRLVRMHESFVRVGRDGSFQTSFADVFPFHMISERSRLQVVQWAGRPLVMERFRPNLVVDGDIPPFDEDGWKRFAAGGCQFNVAKACTRCKVVTVEPENGLFDEDKEPTVALQKYRRFGKTVCFGQNLVPLPEADGSTSGVVRVGDAIDVLDRLDEVPQPEPVE